MSEYTIPLSLGTNGSPLTVKVLSGAVNSNFSLDLVGRGAPGYGLAFARNTLTQLSNSASNKPSNPLIGQLWYNHESTVMMYYSGVMTNPIPGWQAIQKELTTNNADLVLVGGLSLNSFIQLHTQANISALGTSQGAAVKLTASVCEITAASDTANGTVLPAAVKGRTVLIINNTAIPIKVYPSSGQQVESNSLNSSVELGAGARLQFVAISSTKWYMISAVYE